MKNVISFNSKYGWITAFEEKGKITEIKFEKTKNSGYSLVLVNLKKIFTDFFSNKVNNLNFPLDIRGTALQIKIWKELKNIKYGKTKSYGEIAKKYKLSPRHIGKICGQNRLLLLIPCHRVIRSDGSMGGFTSIGGIKLKKKLLELEK